MEPEEIGIFALKADQQRPELVNPRKRAFNREATFVHIAVEMPLPTTFSRFSARLFSAMFGITPTFQSSLRAARVSKLLSALKNAPLYDTPVRFRSANSCLSVSVN